MQINRSESAHVRESFIYPKFVLILKKKKWLEWTITYFIL